MGMKELNGLWKDDRYGLLVQLHGASMRVYKKDADVAGMQTLKATAQIVKGDVGGMIDPTCRLTSVLPKQSVEIRIVNASVRGHPSIWNIEGVVVPSLRAKKWEPTPSGFR